MGKLWLVQWCSHDYIPIQLASSFCEVCVCFYVFLILGGIIALLGFSEVQTQVDFSLALLYFVSSGSKKDSLINFRLFVGK